MPKGLFATLLIPPPEKPIDREAALSWLTHNLPQYESLDESIQHLDRGVLLTEEGPVAEFRPQLGKLARKGQGEEREQDEHPNRVPKLEQFQVLRVPNLADG